MIFSHFKRRRGIRFDDGFRHSARDVAVDPLVATYDAILATDPTVPVLLQLTEYRGQQVLWQDPACTIPVEDIGDPIGGVRHPETGEILAVQTTDAERPAWGGREVGAVFDGSAALLLTDEEILTQPYQDDLLMRNSHIVLGIHADDVGFTHEPLGWRDGNQFNLVQLRNSSDPPVLRHWRDIGTESVNRSSNDLVAPITEPIIISVSVQDRTSRVRIAGTDMISTSTRSEVEVDAVDHTPAIGARNKEGSLEVFYRGTMACAVIYRRVLDDDTVDGSYLGLEPTT